MLIFHAYYERAMRLISFALMGLGMWIMAWTLNSFGCIPAAVTLCPRKSTDCWPIRRLAAFMTRPFCFKRWKASRRCLLSSSMFFVLRSSGMSGFRSCVYIGRGREYTSIFPSKKKKYTVRSDCQIYVFHTCEHENRVGNETSRSSHVCFWLAFHPIGCKIENVFE